MPVKKVKTNGTKWKVEGCEHLHDTKKEAKKQLKAIHASRNKNNK